MTVSAIVANLALNRVITSLDGQQLTDFEDSLNEYQYAQTYFGATITDRKVPTPKAGQVAAKKKKMINARGKVFS